MTANAIGTFDEKGALIKISGYLVDRTEQKNLDDQLRQANRLEALSQRIVAPERRGPEYLATSIPREIERWAAPIKAGGVMVAPSCLRWPSSSRVRLLQAANTCEQNGYVRARPLLARL